MSAPVSLRPLFAPVAVCVAASLTVFGALGAAPALAASPWWRLSVGARPSSLPREATAGSEREIVVYAENVGDGDLSGAHQPAQIVDRLPEGVSVNEALPEASRVAGAIVFAGKREALPCEASSASQISCELAGSLPPYGTIEIRVAVSVGEGAKSGALDEASVTGGEAPNARVSQPIAIAADGGEPASFGVAGYELGEEEEGGAPSVQAGRHPFQQTATLQLNQTADTTAVSAAPDAQPVAGAKDLDLDLPPGLIVNPMGLAQCPLSEFLTPVGGEEDECPAETAVGVASVSAYVAGETETFVAPVFNIEPVAGSVARLGFYIAQIHDAVLLDTSVRSGESYGMTLDVTNIDQAAGVTGAQLTLWGAPGAAEHDSTRGWGCLLRAREAKPGSGELTSAACNPTEDRHPQPLLTLPDACGEAMSSVLLGDSWAQPSPRTIAKLGETMLPALGGCNRMRFEPSLQVVPDVREGSTPSGLALTVGASQAINEDAAAIATSDPRALSVTLPEGMTLNVSSLNGLAACSESEAGAGSCPDASKVATVRIGTPLLGAGRYLEGAAYLASPQNFAGFPAENPFEAWLAIYVLAEEPESGLRLKLAGQIQLGGEPGVEGLAPGQVREIIEGLPQFPIASAEIHFLGGERALLATPAHCAGYTASAMLTPWSASGPSTEASPSSGVSVSSAFEITSAPNGGACPGAALPFSPALAAGPTNLNAGAFGSVTSTIVRGDGQQSVSAFSLRYPAGLSGVLAGVAPCGEERANAGTCGGESQIGEATLSAGLGADPVTLTGKLFLTGPYDGAPFGLSIAVSPDAGPLVPQHGQPIVVRAKVEVDPKTAAVTVTTAPAGQEHSLPASVEGIPLQVKDLNILVNRSGFALNPTSCDPTQVEGSVRAAEGASVPVSTPVQLTNCASLKLQPALALSASIGTSAAQGAGLTAKVSEPAGSLTSRANLAKIGLELPKALSLRHTTVVKACASAQFESNPAGCPPESDVGEAKVTTPLLSVALQGPVLLVSHPGQALPWLQTVLQGEGLSVDLAGQTSTSASGLSAVTFASLPDEPFDTIELTLPAGPRSALQASGGGGSSLCAATKTVTVKKRVKVRVHGHTRHVTRKVKKTEPASKPVARGEIVAQNGAAIHPSVTIAVAGCAKAKTEKKTKAKTKKRKHKGKKGRKS